MSEVADQSRLETENRDEYKFVLARDTELRDDAIKVPDFLYSPDGRKFLVSEWHPSVVAGEAACVTIKAFIQVKS